MTRTEAIEATAADFLRRRMDPEWGAADQAALDGWLGESMAHKAAYWRLEHGWERAGRAISAEEMPAEDVSSVRTGVLRHLRWIAPALAASLCAAVLTLTLMQGPSRPDKPPARIATATGERRTVALADGSTVELNTRSDLRFRISETAREVWLDSGEAFFDVAHAAGRPFVVHSGGRTITVLGTRFSVRCDGNRLRVAVEEGRVRIEGPAAEGSVPLATVTRGSIAVSQGTSTLITTQTPDSVANALSWRSGRLVFDQMRLADAAAEFNRYNRVQLVIADADAAAIRIGGSFEAANVEAFARLLQDAYGLRMVRKGERIIISD